MSTSESETADSKELTVKVDDWVMTRGGTGQVKSISEDDDNPIYGVKLQWDNAWCFSPLRSIQASKAIHVTTFDAGSIKRRRVPLKMEHVDLTKTTAQILADEIALEFGLEPEFIRLTCRGREWSRMNWDKPLGSFALPIRAKDEPIELHFVVDQTLPFCK